MVWRITEKLACQVFPYEMESFNNLMQVQIKAMR